MNAKNRIVSSEDEQLILVDSSDNEVGHLSKALCHDGDGVLHRAFSLFLFNKSGELLLQKRSETKRLWPGFWSNSCCSHPRRGESMDIATARRLNEELNIETLLEHVYHFCYTADFGAAGSENELCHVYLGKVDGKLRPNDSEISSVRFISSKKLNQEFNDSRQSFTPWFKQEWQELNCKYREQLARYCDLA